MPECKHGMDTDFSPCSLCKQEAERKERLRDKSWAVEGEMAGILATFNGRCPECGDAIIADEEFIVKEGDGWIHLSCQ